MNKILIVGRMTKDPETQQTSSGIKYSRFTIAVDRQFTEDQTDFIPIVAWRKQADFIDKYMRKGALVSIEGRFTSNTFQNNKNQTITGYEVTADRIQPLESKAQREARMNKTNQTLSTTKTQIVDLESKDQPTKTNEQKQPEEKKEEEESTDVPWELDL